MILHCFSVHSSFAAFIFFPTVLYSGPAPVLVYSCCLSCGLWSYRFRTSSVIQGWIFFLCLPRTSSAVETSTSFRLFASVFTSLWRMQRAANFPPTLAWNTSAIYRCPSFLRSNQMLGLFLKHFVFSFNLMVAGMRSRSPPVSAPGKGLVFALLMLDLKHWCVRMKSIWLWSCPLWACQVADLGNLWGWRVLARVSQWLSANSRSLDHLSLQCPELACVQAYFGIPVTLNYKYILLGSLLWHCQAACRAVQPPCLHGLRLVHRPEWLWCCVVSLKSGWRWVCWRWVCCWWDYRQLLRYNECHTVLMFWVFSAVPNPVSLIPASFSKTCPSDFRKAQDVPSITF